MATAVYVEPGGVIAIPDFPTPTPGTSPGVTVSGDDSIVLMPTGGTSPGVTVEGEGFIEIPPPTPSFMPPDAQGIISDLSSSIPDYNQQQQLFQDESTKLADDVNKFKDKWGNLPGEIEKHNTEVETNNTARQSFESKWRGLIEGEYFVGSQTQFEIYKKEAAAINAKADELDNKSKSLQTKSGEFDVDKSTLNLEEREAYLAATYTILTSQYTSIQEKQAQLAALHDSAIKDVAPYAVSTDGEGARYDIDAALKSGVLPSVLVLAGFDETAIRDAIERNKRAPTAQQQEPIFGGTTMRAATGEEKAIREPITQKLPGVERQNPYSEQNVNKVAFDILRENPGMTVTEARSQAIAAIAESETGLRPKTEIEKLLTVGGSYGMPQFEIIPGLEYQRQYPKLSTGEKWKGGILTALAYTPLVIPRVARGISGLTREFSTIGKIERYATEPVIARAGGFQSGVIAPELIGAGGRVTPIIPIAETTYRVGMDMPGLGASYQQYTLSNWQKLTNMLRNPKLATTYGDISGGGLGRTGQLGIKAPYSTIPTGEGFDWFGGVSAGMKMPVMKETWATRWAGGLSKATEPWAVGKTGGGWQTISGKGLAGKWSISTRAPAGEFAEYPYGWGKVGGKPVLLDKYLIKTRAAEGVTPEAGLGGTPPSGGISPKPSGGVDTGGGGTAPTPEGGYGGRGANWSKAQYEAEKARAAEITAREPRPWEMPPKAEVPLSKTATEAPPSARVAVAEPEIVPESQYMGYAGYEWQPAIAGRAGVSPFVAPLPVVARVRTITIPRTPEVETPPITNPVWTPSLEPLTTAPVEDNPMYVPGLGIIPDALRVGEFKPTLAIDTATRTDTLTQTITLPATQTITGMGRTGLVPTQRPPFFGLPPIPPVYIPFEDSNRDSKKAKYDRLVRKGRYKKRRERNGLIIYLPVIQGEPTIYLLPKGGAIETPVGLKQMRRLEYGVVPDISRWQGAELTEVESRAPVKVSKVAVKARKQKVEQEERDPWARLYFGRELLNPDLSGAMKI